MQIATITIVVPTAGRFSAKANDIKEKALAKLEVGEYTTDIADGSIRPA